MNLFEKTTFTSICYNANSPMMLYSYVGSLNLLWYCSQWTDACNIRIGFVGEQPPGGGPGITRKENNHRKGYIHVLGVSWWGNNLEVAVISGPGNIPRLHLNRCYPYHNVHVKGLCMSRCIYIIDPFTSTVIRQAHVSLKDPKSHFLLIFTACEQLVNSVKRHNYCSLLKPKSFFPHIIFGLINPVLKSYVLK